MKKSDRRRQVGLKDWDEDFGGGNASIAAMIHYLDDRIARRPLRRASSRRQYERLRQEWIERGVSARIPTDHPGWNISLKWNVSRTGVLRLFNIRSWEEIDSSIRIHAF